MALKLGTGNLLANYSYSDLHDGLYFILHYGGATDNNATTDYHLRTHTWTGNPTSKSETLTTTPDTLEIDLDFDIQFNLPKLLEGELLTNCKFSTYTASGSTTANAYIKVSIIHYDGTTPTTIGTEQTSDTISAGTTRIYSTESMLFDIPKTRFKKGDTLRVKLKVYGHATNLDGASDATLHLSPLSSPADIRVWVPFSLWNT